MRIGKAVPAILIGGGLIGAAVAQELRKPAGEREWVGKLGGVIPYDLRPPTLERVIAEWWSPEDPRILMPHSFGVGWGINVGRLVRLASNPPS
jgi:Family of unknown function (DUF5808)